MESTEDGSGLGMDGGSFKGKRRNLVYDIASLKSLKVCKFDMSSQPLKFSSGS